MGKSVKKQTGGLNRFKDAFDRMAQGSESGTPKIEKGFQLIERAVGALDKMLTQNKLQTWIASISLAKLGDIGDGIKNIASGVNLTTSLEATMTANSKSAKALAANYGYAGKEAKQFASRAAGMAYGMNTSTETTGKAIYAIKTWGKALKAVGITSAKSAVQVAEVYNIDPDQFGNQLTTLQTEFGFTGKELNNLVGSMVAFGKSTGNVKGSLEKMPEMIEMLRKRTHALGKELSGSELAEYATQTQALAAGFYAITQDEGEAQKQAMAVADALIQADTNLGGIFAGTQVDLSDMMKGLGIATGSLDNTFKLLKKGPQGFVQGMAEMVAASGGWGKMTGEQVNFVHKQLSDALGEDSANQMVTFFEKADVATLKAMADVKDATVNLGKMGKEGHSTGITLQESFERMQQGFITTFRKVGRKEARAFVKDTGEQFKAFNKTIARVAEEGGPLGAIVTKFSEMHQIGALALLPETLRPMAAIFGTMLGEATPLIGAMGSLGLRFSHLTNPLTLAVAGFGLLAWSMKAAEKQALKTDKVFIKESKNLVALEKIQKRLQKQGKNTQQLDAQILAQRTKVASVEKNVIIAAKEKNRKQLASVTKGIIEKVGVFFSALPEIFRGVWATVEEMWPEIGPPIYRALVQAFEWVKAVAWPAAKAFIKGVWNGVVDGVDPAMEKTVGGQLGAKFGNILREGLIFAYGAVRTYLKEWWSRMGSIWSDDSLSFTEKVKASVSGSAGLIIAAFAIGKFTPVFSVLGSLSSFIGGTLLKSVGMFGSVLTSVASTGWIMWTKGFAVAMPMMSSFLTTIGTFLGVSAGIAAAVVAVAALAAAFYFFPDATQKALNAIGDFLQTALTWLTEKALDIGFMLVKYMILGPLGMLATMGPKVVGAVVSALKGIVQLAVKAVVGILDGIENWLVKKFPKAAKVIGFVFGVLRNGVKAIGFILERALEGVGIVLNAIGSALSWLGGLVADIFGLWWDITTAVYGAIYDGILWCINKLGEALDWMGEVASDVWDAFMGAVDGVGDALEWLYDNSIGKLVGALDSIGGAIGDVIDGIGGALSSVGGFLSDAGGAVGGFFSDVGSGISDFFGGGGGSGRPLGDVVQEMLDKMDSSLEAAKSTAASLPAAAAPQFARFSSQGIAAADAVRKAYETAVPKDILADGETKKKLEEFRKFQERFDKASAKRGDLSGDTKFLGQFHAASEEVRKLSGHSGQFYLALEQQQKESFTANKADFGEQTQFFIDGYQQRLDSLFDVFSAEKQHLDLMLNSGQITQQEFNTRMAKTTEKIMGTRDELEKTLGMSEENMRKLIGNTTTSAEQLAAVAMIETDKYIAGVRQNMGGLAGEMGAMRDKALAALQTSYAAQVNAVFALPAAQQRTAFAALRMDFAATQTELLAKSAEFTATHTSDITGATTAAQTYFDKLVADSTAATTTATATTTAAVGSMQSVLGIGNEEALRSLETLTNINPVKFEAKLNKIKTSFINFTKAIGEAFKTAWDVALKASADALLAIDADLGTALTQLHGLASAMETKSSAETEARQAARAADIKGMSAGERDQELLNATNWPIWYDDYKISFARLITTVASESSRGGRSASQDTLDKKKKGRAQNGATR